jgi:hypothetical protein
MSRGEFLDNVKSYGQGINVKLAMQMVALRYNVCGEVEEHSIGFQRNK